ncbi:hypothetical protein FO519_002377 [Halicephalobus sp. NKZ332]|nr:hypothetical protein FO519_002377 [Halicephalobus sp. NKZ332]
MKDHLIRVNSVASSSEDTSEAVELRSRGKQNTSSGFHSHRDGDSPTWLGNRVLIERPVKPGDTLNKIALQYSVQIADIKRANNLVIDQDIFALPSIKIPVSRFFADRLNDQPQLEPYRSSVANTKAPPPETTDDKRPLLAFDESDEDSDETERRQRVDEILGRTDANVAQVRENLPSPGLEGGTFHFVDATSPDTTMRSKSCKNKT